MTCHSTTKRSFRPLSLRTDRNVLASENQRPLPYFFAHATLLSFGWFYYLYVAYLLYQSYVG
jgi:hypothetical protein